MINCGKVKISRWCHSFQKDDVAALLHSLSLRILFLKKKTSRKLFRFLEKPRTKQELVEVFGENFTFSLSVGGIIVDEYLDETEFLNDVRKRLLDDITLEIMYLLVTDHCNLKCRYCFEEAPETDGNFKPISMNTETAKRAIDLFVGLLKKYSNPNKKKIIHLYGGEPLLNPEVVKFSVLYLERLKKVNELLSNCEMAIVTNGVLMNEGLAKFFSDHKVTVGLSIDGPRDMNNTYRIAKNFNIDVFEKVLSAYHLLRKYKAKIGLSITLTPLAVTNFDQVLDFFIKTFHDIDGCAFNSIHFNPGVSLGDDYYYKVAVCQLKAFQKMRELGIYEERGIRRAKPFIECKPVFADCGVVGNQLVIAPDGQIGVCQDFVKPRTYFSGSVYNVDYDPIVAGIFDGWRNRSPFFMEACLDCGAIAICGGGCPASAELKTGSRWNIDERICPNSRLFLEWLIWDTYSHLEQKLVL